MAMFTSESAERVRAAATAAIERWRLPGIAVGVATSEGAVFGEAFGVADIESQEPNDPTRLQRIASITKTMTGLCVMALVDEGRLGLDDRVTSLLPEFVFHGPVADMTVRHLLTHTAGIGEAPTLEALARAANPATPEPLKDQSLAGLYPDGMVIELPAGEGWAYANHGFALLGEIVERREGADLGAVMERRIFGPLGMARSACAIDPLPGVTTPYHRRQSDDVRALLERAGIPVPDETPVDGVNIRGTLQSNDHHGMLAAGAAQSNIPDMLRYAAALLRRGAGIVRTETFDAMVAPQACPDERLVSWGLSFSRERVYGRRSFGHGGAYFGGWNSHLRVFPDDGLAVVIHMNVILDAPAPVFQSILRALLDVSPPTLSDAAIPADLLDAAPGTYECTAGRLMNFRYATNLGRISIERDGNDLILRSQRGLWKPGYRMHLVHPAQPDFLGVVPEGRDEPTCLVLERADDGHVSAIRFDDLARLVRRP
ncbi:MAG: beta-lactamase family protein [Chloroflexi bacterium]|nr:beta-lactamase family protein [Chloroflexota bacterium]